MKAINPERLLVLNEKPVLSGRQYIIYRMQSSVRVKDNLALYTAISMAHESGLKLKVVFHLDDSFPDANARSFRFLTEGLKEAAGKLARMGIRFELLYGKFSDAMVSLYSDMAAMVTDAGYLRFNTEQIGWLKSNIPCMLISVEDNLCVPIRSASHKQEWAARTLRPHIMNKLDYFITDSVIINPQERFCDDNIVFDADDRMLRQFMDRIDKNSPLSPGIFLPGEDAANAALSSFVSDRLSSYDRDRNHPERHGTSRLSPYLHFGMISPLTVLSAVEKNPLALSFIEQLTVRRELAHNYVWYNDEYDSYDALPPWCRISLGKHSSDKRDVVYSASQLESMDTHDECWNAAMHEMVVTGYMENTMRMYWGKKIIEWTQDPKQAFGVMAYLNNKYLLDGRDANSWTGVAWSFGLHDRPWKERPVFGTVRYMNQQGLKRKYDMQSYIESNR